MIVLEDMVGMDTSDLKVRFGSWLREKRVIAKKTQEKLAQDAGLSRQTIIELEKGITGTKRDTILIIADALNVDRKEALREYGLNNPGEDDYYEGAVHQLPPAIKNLSSPAAQHLGAFINELTKTKLTSGMNLSNERVTYDRGQNKWYEANGDEITDPLFIREILSDATLRLAALEAQQTQARPDSDETRSDDL